MSSFGINASIGDASFTERGAVSLGAQEVRGPKSVRTNYSQDTTFSAIPVNFASLVLEMGFPETWDIGDTSTFGSSDLMPDGLQTYKMTAPSMPDFLLEALSLGFSLQDPVNNDHSSYWDFDSFTQGGIQIIRQAQSGASSVEMTLRAFGNDGVTNSDYSQIQIRQNQISISTAELLLPNLNSLTVADLTITNLNGSPYSGPVVQSVTNGAGGKGLQLNGGTGDLSYVPDVTIWVGRTTGAVTLTGGVSKDPIFTATAGTSIVVPTGFPNSWWLLTMSCVLTSTNAAEELVGVWLSLDGGSTWEYDETSLPRAYVGATTSVPFSFAFPLALTPGTYDSGNILIAFTGSTEITVNAVGTGQFEARLVRIT